MTTDELERQLRGALRERLDHEQGPDPAWAESPAARRVAVLERRGRWWPLRVLAVAALLGAAGAAALLAGAPNQSLPTTPDAWSRNRFGPPPPHVHAFAAGGPGLVVGGSYDATDQAADIWTSSDGRTWSRVPGYLGSGVIKDVTNGGPGLVAVGSGGRLYAAVWTSRDGLTWSRVPRAQVFEGSTIEAVSAGGPGLVAVGWHNRAWFSSDGLSWEAASVPRVPPSVSLGDDGAHPQVYMSDVAAAGDRLVAVGRADIDDVSSEAVIWTSVDGMTWTNVPLDAEVFPLGSHISSVTGGSDGFIAIFDEGEDSAIRISPDGLHWSRITSDTDPFRSTQSDPDAGVTVNSVTAGRGGHVAVGSDGPDAAIWTSQDGRSWVRVPTGPVFQPSDPRDPDRGASALSVVSWGDAFVVMGGYDGDRAIWISKATSQ